MSTAHPLPAPDASRHDHVRVDGLSRTFADRRVLTDVSFTVAAGERACLIGENGSGKSTLLRLVAGLDRPDAGAVRVQGSVALHHQEPPFDLRLTRDQALARATGPVRALAVAVEREGELLAAGDPSAAARLDRALEAATRLGAWHVERTTALVVNGLGLTTVPGDRPAAELSGGQLSRVCLAWTLLRHPDVLLLDEPTNHLDDRGVQLLTDLLRDWSGPVLMASHDRAFVDEVATTLLDLDPAPLPRAGVAEDDPAASPGSGHGVTRFTGGYTAYLRHRREERRRWVHRWTREQAELTRLRARVAQDQVVGHPDRAPRSEARSARKFYADRNATVVARRVNDAATALDRVHRGQVRRPPARLRFRGLSAAGPEGVAGPQDSPPPTGPLLQVTGLGLAGRLAPVDLVLGARDRVLVTGPNGSGKSTLLQLLAGRLQGTEGQLHRPGGVRVGLLDQEPAPVPGGSTVALAYRDAVGVEVAEQVPVTTFGLLADRDLHRPVASLSVGQRRRLDLAVLLARPPQLLLLDEPTNHLSLLLVSELELSIPHYPGAVVVASHDRWLRQDWAGRRLHLG